MSKKPNPTHIGLFVVIGLALGVSGLVLFGSGKWFRSTEEFIVYFDGSVRGLNAGSAVMVSGVKVGTVKEVLIHFNQEDGDAYMPVVIEVDHDLLHDKTDKTYELDNPAVLDEMVANGLRARLQAESLVTGLLYVDLSVLPNAPPPVYHQVKPLYQEIPSAANDIKMLMENLAQLDFSSLSEKLDAVLVRLDKNLGELQMAEISAGLTNLLTSLNTLVGSSDFTNTMANLNRTLEETGLFASELRAKVGPLGDNAEQLLAEIAKTAAELRLAVDDVRQLLAPEAPLKRDLAHALNEVSIAARSISDLSDYLSRNPNALLSGRKTRDQTP